MLSWSKNYQKSKNNKKISMKEKNMATPLNDGEYFVKIDGNDFINRAHDSIQSYIVTNTPLQVYTAANGKIYDAVPISQIIKSVRKNQNGIILQFIQEFGKPEQLAAMEFIGEIVGTLQGGSLNAESFDVTIKGEAHTAFKELLSAGKFEILTTSVSLTDQSIKTLTIKIDNTSDVAYYTSQIQSILHFKMQAELGIMNQTVEEKAAALRAYANEKIGDLDQVDCECHFHQCTGAELREKGLTSQYFRKNKENEIVGSFEVYQNRDVVDTQVYVFIDNENVNTVSLRELLALAERFGNQLYIGGGLKIMDWQIQEILQTQQQIMHAQGDSQKDE